MRESAALRARTYASNDTTGSGVATVTSLLLQARIVPGRRRGTSSGCTVGFGVETP